MRSRNQLEQKSFEPIRILENVSIKGAENEFQEKPPNTLDHIRKIRGRFFIDVHLDGLHLFISPFIKELYRFENLEDSKKVNQLLK